MLHVQRNQTCTFNILRWEHRKKLGARYMLITTLLLISAECFYACKLYCTHLGNGWCITAEHPEVNSTLTLIAINAVLRS